MCCRLSWRGALFVFDRAQTSRPGHSLKVIFTSERLCFHIFFFAGELIILKVKHLSTYSIRKKKKFFYMCCDIPGWSKFVGQSERTSALIMILLSIYFTCRRPKEKKILLVRLCFCFTPFSPLLYLQTVCFSVFKKAQ